MRSTAPIDKVLKAATDRGDVPGVVAMAADRTASFTKVRSAAVSCPTAQQ